MMHSKIIENLCLVQIKLYTAQTEAAYKQFLVYSLYSVCTYVCMYIIMDMYILFNMPEFNSIGRTLH